MAVCLFLLLAACQGSLEVPEIPPTSRPGITLTPYSFPSVTPTPAPTTRTRATPNPPPTPTATPVLYTIVEGDTLIGIAFRYGLTLADLLAANPGIDPQFLRIGDELIIPLASQSGDVLAVPTPVGAVQPLGEPDCYPSTDGGLWCFWVIANTGAVDVDTLLGEINLFDAAGEVYATVEALPPIERLEVGEALPLIAWFPGGAADYAMASGTLLSAVPVQQEESRYLAVDWTGEEVLLGNRGTMRADLHLAGDVPASQLRLGLIAFDREGRVVGVRTMAAGGMSPGEDRVVVLEVFSLTGEIESIRFLVEATP